MLSKKLNSLHHIRRVKPGHLLGAVVASSDTYMYTMCPTIIRSLLNELTDLLTLIQSDGTRLIILFFTSTRYCNSK